MFIIALPQSNAEVERTFSRLNNNKNKLKGCLAVSCVHFLEAIKSSENFPGDFEVKQRLMHLHGKARKTYFEKI